MCLDVVFRALIEVLIVRILKSVLRMSQAWSVVMVLSCLMGAGRIYLVGGGVGTARTEEMKAKKLIRKQVVRFIAAIEVAMYEAEDVG